MTTLPTDAVGALFAEHALLPSGWARDVLLQWDASGQLLTVASGSTQGGAPRAPGPLLPGMPNLHSHAFQRAFAGLANAARRAACVYDPCFVHCQLPNMKISTAFWHMLPDHGLFIRTEMHTIRVQCGYYRHTLR